MSSDDIKYAFIIVGGLAGILAFLWKIYDSIWTTFLAHLNIDLQADKQKTEARQIIKITTYVENKGVVSKRVAFAFVIVFSKKLDINTALQALTNSSSTDFNNLLYELSFQHDNTSKQTIGKDVIFYPLPYYYNFGSIGNEKLKFAFAQETDELEKDHTYQVMFAIISKPMWGMLVRCRMLFDTFLN